MRRVYDQIQKLCFQRTILKSAWTMKEAECFFDKGLARIAQCFVELKFPCEKKTQP
jgi:hypothetical protein